VNTSSEPWAIWSRRRPCNRLAGTTSCADRLCVCWSRRTDRPGGERLLVVGRKIHLLPLDELGQEEACGLLDLTRPSAVTPGAFRSGLDVHPAGEVRKRSLGAVGLPGLAVDE
jgi:hypothetical protein